MDDLRFAFMCWVTIWIFMVAVFLGGVALFVSAIICTVYECALQLNLFVMGACGAGLAAIVVVCAAIWYWNVLLRGAPSR